MLHKSLRGCSVLPDMREKQEISKAHLHRIAKSANTILLVCLGGGCYGFQALCVIVFTPSTFSMAFVRHPILKWYSSHAYFSEPWACQMYRVPCFMLHLVFNSLLPEATTVKMHKLHCGRAYAIMSYRNFLFKEIITSSVLCCFGRVCLTAQTIAVGNNE